MAGVCLVLSMPGLIFNWGWERYVQKEFDGAASWFETSLNFNLFKFEEYFALGGSLYYQQNYEQAIGVFAQAADSAWTDEGKELAYYNLGNAYYRQSENLMRAKKTSVEDNLLLAIEAYTWALEINPDNLEAYENRELAKKRLEEVRQNSGSETSDDDSERSDEGEEVEESLRRQEQDEQQGREDYNKRKHFEDGFPPRVEGW